MVEPGSPPAPTGPPRESAAPVVALGTILAIALLAVIAWVGSGRPGATAGAAPPEGPVANASAQTTPEATVEPRASLTTTAPPASAPAAVILDGAPPRVGSITAVTPDGALSVIAPDGGARVLTPAGAVTIGFPAWSPDGTRLAASVGADGSTEIQVFPIAAGAGVGTGPPPTPRVVYRSADHAAFYLSWTPDGRDVSFLANDAAQVTLGVAPVDDAKPLTEVGPGSLVRTGAPLYFDWIDADRLLLHVGTGTEAFLGEVGRDGVEIGDTIAKPGVFRSAEVSGDGRYVGYVRATGDHGEVVIAGRAGGPERTLPVYGATALSFDPVADIVAVIGADRPGQGDLGFPFGPLRAIDARSGATRTVLDGRVLAFFWSPDGSTLAAIRLQAGSGSTAAGPIRLASATGPETAASPSAPPNEAHLLFVDAATGEVRSDRVFQPGSRFVSEFLPYFDQYGLSHRLWAPDSSLFLLPIAGADGRGQVLALRPDGEPAPFTLAADAAFWSP